MASTTSTPPLSRLNPLYFITTSAVRHTHIFQSDVIKRILVDSLNTGRILRQYSLFAFVIMPNHIHLLLRCSGGYAPADVIREYKKATANLILRHYECEGNDEILWALAQAAQHTSRKNFAVWEEEYQAKVAYAPDFLRQKLNYIHNNPLQAHWQLAERPEQYMWSSARFYAGAGRALIPLSDVRKLL